MEQPQLVCLYFGKKFKESCMIENGKIKNNFIAISELKQ